VAEYLGQTIDERQRRAIDRRNREWLATIEPYPRLSVSTSVLDNASTRVMRVLHQPVLTGQHTFTFVRETDAEETFDARASAEVIASTVETMRRQARLETDRIRDLWETAATAYSAALSSAEDDQRQLAAERAAATALSDHINASLLKPPLVE
jgi:AcrR family transcriptional regulator